MCYSGRQTNGLINVYIFISGTMKMLVFMAKRVFADVIKLRILRIGHLSCIIYVYPM